MKCEETDAIIDKTANRIYDLPVKIEFDPDKNAENIRVRGLPFERVSAFDFETALYHLDNRQDYGEKRVTALGILDNRIHVPVFAKGKKDSCNQFAQGK